MIKLLTIYFKNIFFEMLVGNSKKVTLQVLIETATQINLTLPCLQGNLTLNLINKIWKYSPTTTIYNFEEYFTN